MTGHEGLFLRLNPPHHLFHLNKEGNKVVRMRWIFLWLYWWNQI